MQMPSRALNGPGYLESGSPFHASLQGLFPFPQPFGNWRVCECQRGGKLGRKCPNQGTPACVGAFREEAGGELSLAAPALCPQHRGWGEAFLNPAGAPAGPGHGLCILLAKNPSCPCMAVPAAPGWQVNKHLHNPQTEADGKVMERGEHQTAPASHCSQDLITPLLKPVITLRGQLVLMA